MRLRLRDMQPTKEESRSFVVRSRCALAVISLLKVWIEEYAQFVGATRFGRTMEPDTEVDVEPIESLFVVDDDAPF